MNTTSGPPSFRASSDGTSRFSQNIQVVFACYKKKRAEEMRVAAIQVAVAQKQRQEAADAKIEEGKANQKIAKQKKLNANQKKKKNANLYFDEEHTQPEHKHTKQTNKTKHANKPKTTRKKKKPQSDDSESESGGDSDSVDSVGENKYSEDGGSDSDIGIKNTDGEDVHVVEEVCAQTVTGRGNLNAKLEYKIKWKGHPTCTWESADRLEHAHDAVKIFEDKRREKEKKANKLKKEENTNKANNKKINRAQDIYDDLLTQPGNRNKKWGTLWEAARGSINLKCIALCF